MYNIEDHIEGAARKEEYFTVGILETIETRLENTLMEPFHISEATVLVLEQMVEDQRAKRSIYPHGSLDHGEAWSILTVMENVLMLVRNSLQEKGQ